MLFVGYWLERNPNFDIATGNGYATKQSCQSQENWDYAQIKAPPIFFKVGAIATGVLVVLLIIDLVFSMPFLPYVSGVVGLGSLAGTYLYVEDLIKKNGPNFK